MTRLRDMLAVVLAAALNVFDFIVDCVGLALCLIVLGIVVALFLAPTVLMAIEISKAVQ